MLDPLPVPACLWDLRTETFLGSNQALRDLLGYTEGELLQLHWRKLIAPEDIDAAERAIKVRPSMNAVRWRWLKKNGQIITVTLASRQICFVDDTSKIHDAYMALVLGVDEEQAIPAAKAFPPG